MNWKTFGVVLLCMGAIAAAEIRVAVHEDSCNYASLHPAYEARKSISQQLDALGIKATFLTDDKFDSSSFNDDYDVVYLGCGGKDLDLDAVSSKTAQTIVNFVNAGHGLVLSATTATAFSSVRSILSSVLPFSGESSAWARTTSGNTMPLMTFDETKKHYITSSNITATSVAPLAYAFFVQEQPKSGWQSLASVSTYTAECCFGFSECDAKYCDPYANQGILYKEVSKGRVVYTNFAYCGYDMFNPQNLRTGVMNQLFLNMIYWTSGLCKGVNECSNHGACTGENTCVCEDGWTDDGSQKCAKPHCSQTCQNGGTCGAPDMCECKHPFRGTTCELCVYPRAGTGCESYVEVQDLSFEKSKSESVWVYSGEDYPLKTSHNGVTPKDANQMLVIGSTTARTVSASQKLFIMNNAESSPALSFWYQAKGISLSQSSLQVLVDDKPIWTSTPGGSVSSWTNIMVSLGDFSSNDGQEHIITIKGTLASEEKGAFYVDLVTYEYPTCNPSCENGVCALKGNSPVCVCNEHYEGAKCDTPVCGDGYIILPETCDDGNKVDGDGCTSDCKIEDGWECPSPGKPCVDICGDGRTMSSEPDACDDGNTMNGDGCSANCHWELYYKCTQSKQTRSVCSVRCGDGYIYGAEVCDDGNTDDNDGCSADCSRVNKGWDCTSMTQQGGNTCRKEVCGDGVRTKSEECDDGLVDGKHGCTSDCKIMKGFNRKQEIGHWVKSEMVTDCGDGLTAGDEECDGGGFTAVGCETTCKAKKGYVCNVDPDTLESTCKTNCGDGSRTSDEECDNGNQEGCEDCKVVEGYHCTGDIGQKSVCEKNVCGDKTVHWPETCDIGGKDDPGCVKCKLTPGYACDDKSCHTVCGDNVLTSDEICDDGNTLDNDGCEADCQKVSKGYDCKTVDSPEGDWKISVCVTQCGNGILTTGEDCDDGNTEDYDGCSSMCRIETGFSCDGGSPTVCTPDCGDGIRVGNETCDEGGDTNGCVNCQVEFGYKCNPQGHECKCIVGDWKVCKEEECDDGNTRDGDGCSSEGKIEKDWVCKIDEEKNYSICVKPGCPNAWRGWDEECDDNNNIAGDGCTNCKLDDTNKFDCFEEFQYTTTHCIERKCGNGNTTSDEECDDGNLVDGDGCDKNCKKEKFFICTTFGRGKSTCYRALECGDGYRHFQEKCDDGNLVNGDGCNEKCEVEDGWACDDDSEGKSECHVITCGDGKKEGHEECDDGNSINGDGCDENCKIENGFQCFESYKKSVCKSYCGDGMRSATEECDDGNVIGGDGCSPTCQVEHGYFCFENATCFRNCQSICYATCGDGIVAQEEECDDGNTFQGDGCFNCQLESSDWRCTGEPSTCIMRKCTLPRPTATHVDVLCNGALSGSIDIEVDSTEDVIAKVWKEDEQEPDGYQATRHFGNLGGGKYIVAVTISGFEECVNKTNVTITEPAALVAGKPKVTIPTKCDSADGRIEWTVKGGVGPYKFTFGNRTPQATGVFEAVTVNEIFMGYPQATDSNNCTVDMDPKNNWLNPETSCKGNSIPYLLEGAVIIAGALCLVLVMSISYICWSSKKQVPRQRKK